MKHTWTWFCEIHAGRVWVISPKTALRIWLDDSQSVITHNLMPLSRNNSRTWWGCLMIKVHHFKGKAKKGKKSYTWKKKVLDGRLALVRVGLFYMSTTTCTIILTKIINKHVLFFFFFTVYSQNLEYKTEWLVFELKSKSLYCQCVETQKAFPFPFSFALCPSSKREV